MKLNYNLSANPSGADLINYVNEQISALEERLTRKRWDDLRTPVDAVKVSGTKPPTWTAYKGSEVLAFSDQAIAGNEEHVFFTIQLPHGYMQGSSITPHVHWVPEDNTGGNVRWALTYTWADYNAVFLAEQTIYAVGAAGTTTDFHNRTYFSEISGAGKHISSMLLCKLQRNSSDATDTYNGKSVYLLEIDFHVKLDALGSLIATGKAV